MGSGNVPREGVWKTSPRGTLLAGGTVKLAYLHLWWLSLLLLAVLGCAEPVHIEDSRQTPWGDLEIELYSATESVITSQLDDIDLAIDRLGLLLDPAAAGGELSLLNQAATNDYYRVDDPDLFRLIRLSLDYSRASDGAFDPTVEALRRLYARGPDRRPSEGEISRTLNRVGWQWIAVAPEAHAVYFRRPGMVLDLQAVSRGALLDVAARTFVHSGSHAGLLRLGKSQLAWRSPPGSDSWGVVLTDPRDPGKRLGTVHVANRGITIAGQPPLEQPPILDPRTGRPASNRVLAAVALADSVSDADALSAALFVAGVGAGGELLTKTRRAEAILLVEGDGSPRLLVSASLEGKIDFSAELLRETEGRVRYILPPQPF
jgi:thiamine biosynthesis lipoprotein